MRYKVVLVFLAILILLLTSETLYNINTNPDLQYHLHQYLAVLSIKASQPQLAFKYIGGVADYKIQNPELQVEEVFNVGRLPDNPKLKIDFANFLARNQKDLLENTDFNYWSKTFYKLGLIAYQDNEPELVEEFWQSAINFSPQWSYYHIELANYYSSTNNHEKAERVLSVCMELQDPRLHCQQYYNQVFVRGRTEEVGFLKDEIEKI